MYPGDHEFQQDYARAFLFIHHQVPAPSTSSTNSFPSHPQVDTFVEITVKNLVKRTRLVQSAKGNPVWNQLKNFPVVIMRDAQHPFNILQIDMKTVKKNKEYTHGNLTFHLHDIVKVGST
eukprot:TRINITY_DN1687_c1_g2_i1.p1 TRINITY_DN1687_c1_g2~~TRINITY_DN1687_c1_g2_i1.p1  ORF type:complete len:120 (+),score=16.16 TRINITY_DN1687_c1_g2_i1:129-488(+)